jgi:hypothetical protein
MGAGTDDQRAARTRAGDTVAFEAVFDAARGTFVGDQKNLDYSSPSLYEHPFGKSSR